MRMYDILIIGAGASGMMSAITAKFKNSGLSIALIEKNDRVGKKLIATGNGRCNITNDDISKDHYYSSCENYFDYFSGFLTEQTETFFNNLGVIFKRGDDGKVYPYSLQASSVLDALRFKCEQCGIDLHCGCRVISVNKTNEEFDVLTGSETFRSKVLIVAAGGAASDKLGGCNDGYTFLKSLGHKCTPLYPSITAVKTDISKIRALKGIKTDTTITICTDKCKKSVFGEVLFTEYGLSGPPVLQLSQVLHGKADGAYFLLDLMPEYSFNQVLDYIKYRCGFIHEDKLENLFVGMLNKRIGQAVVKSAGLSLSQSASILSEKEMRALSSDIKKFRINITGVKGFEYAQVTGGGIDLREFDVDTLQSRKCKNLFACGEVLDMTGDCGGYNLQWAWASGHSAGTAAADAVQKRVSQR